MGKSGLLGGKPRGYAVLLALIGLVLLAGGGKLLLLGGSPYYIMAGALVIASAVFLWQGRREGTLLYGVMLAGTIAWAIWEVGFDGWALTARLAAPALLGLWLLTPWVQKRLKPQAAISWTGLIGGAAVAILLGWGLHAAFADKIVDPVYQAGVEPAAPQAHAAAVATGHDWQNYGNDPGGSRFSPLAQITPANVDKLQVAWTFRIGPAPKGAPTTLEVTPIKVGSRLYLCTAYNDIVALDAASGKQLWRFKAHTDLTGAAYAACRGVAYYKAPQPTGDCDERIITNTVDARLIAVDARTGKLCRSFGNNGVTSLLTGLSKDPKGYYYVSSAPTIVHGKVVLGGWVFDNQSVGEPSGVIRAYDAMTGQLAWAFDMGHPDWHGTPPPGETYTRGTPNSWAPMSADETLGLVYAPTGIATPDGYGVFRRPFDEKYGSGVLAIDADTGALRWSFQTTHHDLWDYDVASQPTLIDLPKPDGGREQAMIVPTKRGEIFLLDRVTGKPIAPVTEQPVPQGGTVPKERLSKTQPFSDAMPSFRGPNLTEKSMWGITPLDQMACRILFRQSRYEGPLTPPGTGFTLAYPGFLGGVDWGGVSVDPDRHLLIVNSNRMANRDQLIPRPEADTMGVRASDPAHGIKSKHLGTAAQSGTPYAFTQLPFLSPIFSPCQAPPWGMISAVDLVTHKLVWTHPIGSARDAGPLGLPSMLPLPMGMPNMGGTVTTRGGLIFIAATMDRDIRAIETTTGRVLWSARLPAGGQATPMTYMTAAGRQLVVIAAGGHPIMNTKKGDYVIAYGLPATKK